MTTPQPIAADLQLLEPLLRTVAEAAGLDAAMRLVTAKGGTIIWVPEEATPDHPFVELLTMPGLRALVVEYGKSHQYVPQALAALRQVRNRRIAADRARKSIAQLAREHRLSMRRVKQVVAETCGQLDDDDTAEGQPRLFE